MECGHFHKPKASENIVQDCHDDELFDLFLTSHRNSVFCVSTLFSTSLAFPLVWLNFRNTVYSLETQK